MSVTMVGRRGKFYNLKPIKAASNDFFCPKQKNFNWDFAFLLSEESTNSFKISFKLICISLSVWILRQIVWFSQFCVIVFRKYVLIRLNTLKLRSLSVFEAGMTKQYCVSWNTWLKSAFFPGLSPCICLISPFIVSGILDCNLKYREKNNVGNCGFSWI